MGTTQSTHVAVHNEDLMKKVYPETDYKKILQYLKKYPEQKNEHLEQMEQIEKWKKKKILRERKYGKKMPYKPHEKGCSLKTLPYKMAPHKKGMGVKTLPFLQS